MTADLEMPARDVASERPPDAARPEPADRHAGPLAVVDHRHVDPRPADVGQGTPIGAPPGDLGDGGPVDAGPAGLVVGRLARVTSRPR